MINLIIFLYIWRINICLFWCALSQKLKVDKNKFVKKIFTNYFESGRFGMSTQLLKKGFKLLIVNSENKKFNIHDWIYSKTAFFKNQEKLVISDHRTREFDLLPNNMKSELTRINWGI